MLNSSDGWRPKVTAGASDGDGKPDGLSNRGEGISGTTRVSMRQSAAEGSGISSIQGGKSGVELEYTAHHKIAGLLSLATYGADGDGATLSDLYEKNVRAQPHHCGRQPGHRGGADVPGHLEPGHVSAQDPTTVSAQRRHHGNYTNAHDVPLHDQTNQTESAMPSSDLYRDGNIADETDTLPACVRD